MSIIKRKKQDKFFMLSNATVQDDLESLSAIGLLAYIISLPSDFTLYKTFLFDKFKRAAVTKGWDELVEKGYICGFIAYIERRKTYFYLASDLPLSQNEFFEFVDETCKEYLEKDIVPKSIKEIPGNPYNITTDEIQQYSNLLLLINNSSPTTVVNQHIKEKHSSLKKNIEKEILVNKKKFHYYDIDFKEVCYSILDTLYPHYASGIYSKREWNIVTNKLLDELIENKLECTNLDAYLEGCIRTITNRRKRKLGIAEEQPGVYNWLYD